MQEPTGKLPEYRKYCEEARDKWMDRKHQESLAHDNALLTLSSGGIGLTLIVLAQLAPVSSIGLCTFAFVFLSWISFGLSIVSSLLSRVSSQKAMDAVMDIWEARATDSPEAKEKERKAYKQVDFQAKKTNRQNCIARWSFFTAIVFALIFAVTAILEAQCQTPSQDLQAKEIRVLVQPGLTKGKDLRIQVAERAEAL